MAGKSVKIRWFLVWTLGLTLAGCANQPLDCAIGFHHSDCKPGTRGYDDPTKFAVVDDRTCQSYGLKVGTADYAQCRIKLNTAREKGVLN
jgi:hypothetical protein